MQQTHMPTLWMGAEGEEEEIDAIVAFLQSLGKQDVLEAQASVNN